MYNKYDKFLTGKGYVPVQEFFEEWDYVKDELVKNDRKTGTGNGTFHFFLGAKNTDLITKLLKGKTEIDVKHYIDVNMLYSMLGYCIKNSHNNNVTFDINDYSTRLFNIKGDYLEFTSQLKFQDTRPYFKQFHNQELLRDLLFPKTSKYKFKMYQHNISKDIAVCWILGNSEYDNLSITTISPKQSKSSFDTIICNKIYFGCPGTGKSHKINQIINNIDKSQWERVTFHPEYDYASFVGAYKPFSTKDDNNKDIIKYDFVPQAFTDIYVRAWKGLGKEMFVPYFLIIEEINRGNCAEIFGDIFQLLDRNANYEVSTSQELKKYLVEQLGETHEGIKDGLKLPPNLTLLATMNTSDQSLFPMDSAFKRRWEWEYVPINYKDSENQIIQILDKKYSWTSFLKVINEKIYQITESEDKQMGNRFVDTKGVITEEILLNKIMFYLWFDVFKNEDSRSPYYIFKKNPIEKFKYADLFDENGTQTLTSFLAHNQIVEI